MNGEAVRFAYVTVRDEDSEDAFAVRTGRTLRDALRERGHSPYARLTERANCGGRGICATCGVRIEAAGDPVVERDEGDAPADAGGEAPGTANEAESGAVPGPDHWHDRLADRFGYPRLSCQITVDRDLVVRIPEKRIWGGREP